MILAMAKQVTGTGSIPAVREKKFAVTIGRHNLGVEVNKMRVIVQVALRAADAMRIVANIARRVFTAYVFVVFSEALVIQNTVPAVARIAKCIIEGTLLRIVQRSVISDQYRLEL